MKKIKINKKVIIFISILICLAFIVRSFAKYVIQKIDTHIQSATEFYFESNIAKVDTGEYTIKDWDGTEQTIEFTVKNYLNKLSKTSEANEEITYKISAKIIGDQKNDINVAIKDQQNNEILENETITNTEFNEKKYTLIISPVSIQQLTYGEEIDIKLTITSISPYEKELISNIKLVYNQIENYETNIINSENGEYVTLNIKINQPQDITITYNNTKLMLDKSNYMVSNVNVTGTEEINTFTLLKDNFEKEKSYEIYFIKLQEEITETDIKVE